MQDAYLLKPDSQSAAITVAVITAVTDTGTVTVTVAITVALQSFKTKTMLPRKTDEVLAMSSQAEGVFRRHLRVHASRPVWILVSIHVHRYRACT